MSKTVINIAGYQFVELDRLAERRQDLLRACKTRAIKGTILLSPEGINLFLAGSRNAIDEFLAFLRSDSALQGFQVKESQSDRQPFNRLLVRLKKEIIAFGVPGIDPQHNTSPKLKPAELKQWLDEGKPVQLLDVRNNYEVELGTFKNAIPADIDHFRQFPQAIQQMESLRSDLPIVMFCTGGIRCEKAGPFLERQGFDRVFQLEGGILQYFEDCGGQYYDGDCFVFDQRVAVDPALQETDAEVCFVCQAVLGPEQLNSPQYVAGQSCPNCFETEEDRQARLRKQRKQQWTQLTNPLPGSLPYDNYRPLNVPRRFDGYPLIEFLSEYHPHVGRDVWGSKVDQGRILLDQVPLKADHKVHEGQRLEHLLPATVEPAVNCGIGLIYEDAALVVINKPAPLPMHPSGRFNRNTLTWILDQVYDQQLRAAHRLDANTTGLVVFSKTRAVAALVQPQFESQQVHKQYLALVQGLPAEDEFDVAAAIADQPTLAGGRRIADSGKDCLTRFRVLQRDPVGNLSLLQAIPHTGRTNQIRIHLWEAGFPIVGDPTYLSGKQMSETQTLSVSDPPMCLHAYRIRFLHPISQQAVEFTASLPDWGVKTEIAFPKTEIAFAGP